MDEAPSRQGEPGRVFDERLEEACAAIGVSVAASQRALMLKHYEQVIKANRQFNLTRITAPEEAAVKHYADSLSLLTMTEIDRDRPLTVLDVGTGAGFPAVPLAIACPAWRVTAIDGTGKKARFVAESAAGLGLENLVAWHVRAGDLAKSGKTPTDGELPPLTGQAGRFDLILLRAVAPLAKGLREVQRLIAPGGSVVFYKTANIDTTELDEGQKTARELGLTGRATRGVTIQTKGEPLQRRLIRYTRSK
jgi:16S rRNA (guanine527-N7)-methyltransferase